MDEQEELNSVMIKNYFPIPYPTLYWFTELIILQADIFYNCLITLFSPFIFLSSLLSKTLQSLYYQPPQSKETKETEESNHVKKHPVAGFTTKVASGSGILVKKVVFGFLGSIYVCMILMLLLVISAILGVGWVQFWAEEPVFMKERLHFDYTRGHPPAVFSFHKDGWGHAVDYKKKENGVSVPVGHTFYVSLVFLMPESDYNREIGLFQVTAEVISRNGNIMEKASHPCMLRFRSWPIRTMQTFLIGIPLLLGITAETQKIIVPMIKHKESFPRTEAIRITLIPRAGTDFLPQIYNAEIVLKSELPLGKELVRRWKWTLYVWTSMYMYFLLLAMLLCCSRPLILPLRKGSTLGSNGKQKQPEGNASSSEERSSRHERNTAERLRRWQENRSKRKALLINQEDVAETAGSSASSISLTREDTGLTLEEDYDDDEEEIGDSESVCCKGDLEE